MRLSVENVTLRVQGRTLVEGLSFGVQKGMLLALMGPSGVGKSTLLSALAGYDKPTEGTITLSGNEGRRARTDWIVQSAPLLLNRTALDNTLLAARIRWGASADLKRQALNLLESVGLGHVANKPAYRLSGGERQRVAVVRAVLSRPDLLLADEPSASLDFESRDSIVRCLQEARATSAVVVATHDPAVAAACDDVLRLSDFRG